MFTYDTRTRVLVGERALASYSTYSKFVLQPIAESFSPSPSLYEYHTYHELRLKGGKRSKQDVSSQDEGVNIPLPWRWREPFFFFFFVVVVVVVVFVFGFYNFRVASAEFPLVDGARRAQRSSASAPEQPGLARAHRRGHDVRFRRGFIGRGAVLRVERGGERRAGCRGRRGQRSAGHSDFPCV